MTLRSTTKGDNFPYDSNHDKMKCYKQKTTAKFNFCEGDSLQTLKLVQISKLLKLNLV